MADERPVHVLPRDEGWAVVREGNDRATSLHRTQAEAAEAGREVARKHGTSFLLHAKDGRVRDRRDYGAGSGSPEERPEGPASAADDAAGGVAGAATRMAGGAVGLAPGAVGGAVEGIGGAGAGRGAGQSAGQGGAASHEKEKSDYTEEAFGLAYEERYADYEVYDREGERLGNVETLFLDEDDRPEYMGVKMGLLGTRSTLIPWAAVTREDEEGRRLEVGVNKETAENGPALEEDQGITPELEREVHRHYGLERATEAGDRGAYGEYYPRSAETGPTAGTPDPDIAVPGLGTGGAEASPSRAPGHEGGHLREPGTDPEEIRVRRSEEELVAGTTRREAGALRVRKRVRIERETIEVPVRREEVYVERVPLSGEAAAAEAEIGEEEIVVPVVEEEVVVEKRPVAKEEVRVRKDVVEDIEVVEEDVRREEIDIEDDTTRSDA